MTEMAIGDDGSYVNPHSGEPLQDQWIHDATQTDNAPDAWAEMKPIPVRIHHDDIEQVAPQGIGLTTVAIPQIPQVAGTGALQAALVCPHRYRRYKAKFLFSGGGAGTIYVAKDPNTLMSGALGAAFAITVAAALTQSTALMPEYDGAQPLYMMATVTGFTVSVMDEGYKTVQ